MFDSGYITIAEKSTIYKGMLNDYYQKTILSVACFGDAKTNPRHTKKTYRLYKNMLSRCYDPKNKDYHNYHDKGVFVDDRWLNYNNFLNDLYDLKGFNLEDFNNGLITLDKDELSDINNKVYSKETCQFVSMSKNISIRNTQNSLNPNFKNILVKDDFGNEEIIKREDLKEYCEKKDLSINSIWRVLRKERKTYKSKFYTFI